ncbi:hypothetical protein SAMN06298216_4227 [Spirosomataceae bacterium TFI 002]|nr:hypothetical protein SAMN06298216_4227 [Spirosomataceae bacterium TFI 002]
MSNIRNLLAILILGTTDAYLISHPNILGKLGVFVFKYGMIKNFSNALITVFITLGICIALAYFIEKYNEKSWAKYLLIACTGLSLFILGQVVYKFSGGTYAHTGKSFVWGMILLPVIMLYIFGTVWFSKKTSKVTETGQFVDN